MISEELEKIIQNAFELAKKKNHEFLTLEHLLLELCKDKEVQELFKTFVERSACSHFFSVLHNPEAGRGCFE